MRSALILDGKFKILYLIQLTRYLEYRDINFSYDFIITMFLTGVAIQ